MDMSSVGHSVPDLHICGTCQKKFSEIHDFVEHKKSGCKLSSFVKYRACVSESRESARTTDNPDKKFVQASVQLDGSNNDLPVALQVQQLPSATNTPTVTAGNVLTLSSTEAGPDRVIMPCLESMEGQSSMTQIQTTQLLRNISLQDMPLVILFTNQQQQQLLQSSEQQLPNIVQHHEQHLQQLMDLEQQENSKTASVSYNGSLPVFHLEDSSTVTEVLHENIPTTNIHALLQPALGNSDLEQEVKVAASHSVLSAVQHIQDTNIEGSSNASPQSTDDPCLAPCPSAKPANRSEDRSSLRFRYQCQFKGCKYVTQYSKNVERHMLIHTGEKPFLCTQCKSRFSRSDKLKNHQRIHTGDKPFHCNVCEYRCADNSSLKKHKRIHSDERPFKCQICCYASRNSSQLTVHLRTHTGDKPFMCPECCATFKIKSDLKRHRRIHTGEKPYNCDLCDFKTAVNSNLKAHMKTYHCEENMMKCKKCDFSTSSKRVFKTHMKIHTPTDQHLVCPQCTYTCSNNRLLQTHVRTHSDERPYKCLLCHYNTKTKTCLNSHMRNQHPKEYFAKHGRRSKRRDVERPKSEKRTPMIAKCLGKYKCQICELRFVRSDSLRSHLRSHEEKDVYDSEKKRRLEMCSSESAAVSSPATSTQPARADVLSYVSLNSYSINQEHEYATPVETEVYTNTSTNNDKLEEVTQSRLVDSDIRDVGVQKYTQCHDLQNLLPFIQNNHNTAVWENIQNLAALSQGQGHPGKDQQGHSGHGQVENVQEVIHHWSEKNPGDNRHEDPEISKNNQDHGMKPGVCFPSSNSVCDAMAVTNTIQMSGSSLSGEGTSIHETSTDQDQQETFEHLVQDVVDTATSHSVQELVPNEIIYTDDSTLHSHIISSDSQPTLLITSDCEILPHSKNAQFTLSTVHQTPEQRITSDTPNRMEDCENPKHEDSSVPFSDGKHSNNVTVVTSEKNADAHQIMKAIILPKSAIITLPYNDLDVKLPDNNEISNGDVMTQYVESVDVVVENNNSPETPKSDLPLIVESLYTTPRNQDKN